MATQRTAAYRAIVREVNRTSIYPRATRPATVSQHIRDVFEQHTDEEKSVRFYHDMRNVATFMTSQRIHKTLLERYNPLHGMSTEERVKKTAHRVGLDMPVGSNGEDP